MNSQSEKPVTKQEFSDWTLATKETFNLIEERLGTIEKKLEPLEIIATELKAIRENTAAMLTLYRRLDHRDYVFADKLKLDLRKIDAEV